MILDEILAAKKDEVARAKRRRPLEQLLADLPRSPPRHFLKAIHRPGRLSVIAEIKYASPSQGRFGLKASVPRIAKAYQRFGAQALSVLTDRRFFKGSGGFIRQAKAAASLPILRKDFIIDEYQIYESRWLGADAILLIVGVLSEAQLRRFLEVAKKLRLACLVEVHDRAELRRALAVGAHIIGINNRDLRSFRVDLATSERLRPLIPKGKVVVSESGIRSRADVEYLECLRVDAILVGEALVRGREIGKTLLGLRGARHDQP